MHDVIIIGAGPAGNHAALDIAKAGFSVKVYDWRTEIGDKLCTGIIGQSCFNEFPPSKDEIYRSTSSANIVSPLGKTYLVDHNNPQAYVINRISYVKSFAEKAIKAGASYRLNEKVISLNITDREVTVTSESNGRNRKDTCKAVIIATGFGSPLLKMAGLGNGGVKKFLTGCQTTVYTEDLLRPAVFLGSKIGRGSFGWLVPTQNNQALLGLATSRKLNGHMDNLTEMLKAKGYFKETEGPQQKWGIPVNPSTPTYNNRALSIGDAAGLTKPTTGGGIYYSLLSGKLAAQTLIQALNQGDLSSKQLKPYESEWKHLLSNEINLGNVARRIFESLRDSQIEFLISKLMTDEVREDILESSGVSFDWHGGIIKNAFMHSVFGKYLGILTPEINQKPSDIRSPGSIEAA